MARAAALTCGQVSLVHGGGRKGVDMVVQGNEGFEVGNV